MDWEILYPVTQKTDSSKFDISLLTVLFRHICNLSPPLNGWDQMPNNTDISTEANLVRLRLFRNRYRAHLSETIIESHEFNRLWSEIETVLIQLGCPKAEISKAKNSPLDPVQYKRFQLTLKKLQDVEDLLDTCNNVSDSISEVKLRLDTVDQRLSHVETEVLTKMPPGEVTNNCYLALEKIMESLKEQYIDYERVFSPLEWNLDFLVDLDKVYVKLEMVKESLLGDASSTKGKSTHKVYNAYDAFTPHENCRQPTRSVIIAEAGMGKTTTCRKLASDYAQNLNVFTSTFPHIKLLIFISCRSLSCSLPDHIASLLLPTPVDKTDKRKLMQYLKSNPQKIMFLIDGLDELKEDEEWLELLLKGQFLSGSFVLATTRPEGWKDKKAYFHSCYRILRFSENDINQYVGKYLGEDRGAKELIDLIGVRQELHDLSRVPLCLNILCFLWSDLEGRLPERITDLFVGLIDCLLKRFIAKKGGKFSVHEVRNFLLFPLCELAFRGLQEKKAYFLDLDLHKTFHKNAQGEKYLESGNGDKLEPSHALQLGLVVSSGRSTTKLLPCYKYTFVHKYIQEFLSAQYVILTMEMDSAFDIQDSKWLLELTRDPFPTDFTHKSTMQFLIGLMKVDKLVEFFSETLEVLKLEETTRSSCPAWSTFGELSPADIKQFAPHVTRYLPNEIWVVQNKQNFLLDLLLSQTESKSGASNPVVHFEKLGLVKIEADNGENICKIISHDSLIFDSLEIHGELERSVSDPIFSAFWQKESMTKLILHR